VKNKTKIFKKALPLLNKKLVKNWSLIEKCQENFTKIQVEELTQK
jgi:hypothetical protein